MRIALLLLLLASSVSCGNQNNSEYTKGKGTGTNKTGNSDSSSGQTLVKHFPKRGIVSDYHANNGLNITYYIPEEKKPEENLPIIIFLDPHGKGQFPVTKYKSLADQFEVILVGSNDSKNGMSFDVSTKIVSDLKSFAEQNFNFSDSMRRKPIRVFLAGFSGGAKAALVAANTSDGFTGTIYCGAAFPPKAIPDKVDDFGIAGREDMNYSEVRKFHASFDQSQNSHVLSEWDGKHEWPDSLTFSESLFWVRFEMMRKGFTGKDTALIAQFINLENKRIAKEKSLTNKAMHLNKSIRMLSQIDPAKKYRIQLEDILTSEDYKKAKAAETNALAVEENQKGELIEAFQSKDLSWWKIKIDGLRNTQSPGNRRLLGFISLAAWSYSSKAIAGGDYQFARNALKIYKLADPDNAEQPYLLACLFSQTGLQDSAMYYLSESIRMGFDDKLKLETEQSLFALHDRYDFHELLSHLK